LNYKLYPLGECIQKKFSTTQLERIDIEMKNAIEKHIDSSVWYQMHNNSMYLMNIFIGDSLENRPVLGTPIDDWANSLGWAVGAVSDSVDGNLWNELVPKIVFALNPYRRDGADIWLRQ
jgi:hypothetical protein